MRRKASFKSCINRFIAWARASLAERTAAAYEWQLKHALKAMGDRPLAKLRPCHFTPWAKTWHQWQAVMRMLNWAVHDAGIIRENPYSRVKAPPRNERRRILSPGEILRLMRRASRPARAFLLALRETYARPQEIRAACWDDLHAEDPGLSVKEALQQGKALIVLRDFKDRKRRKEASSPRVLLVSLRLGRSLLRLSRCRGTFTGPIWLNRRRRPWTNNAVRCLFRRLRTWLKIQPDKFGETVVAYTFRHSVATLASARGIKDRLLADLLGHVETRTTRRYQHLDVGHLRDALRSLSLDRWTGRKK